MCLFGITMVCQRVKKNIYFHRFTPCMMCAHPIKCQYCLLYKNVRFYTLIIYTTKIRNRVETLYGGRGWTPKICGHVFEGTPPKVMQRWSCFRNAPWPPYLTGRPLDRSVMHSWVNWSQPGVKFRRNDLWQPNLIGQILNQNAVHWLSHRSRRGQAGQPDKKWPI